MTTLRNNTHRWPMDNQSTFLEFPLDRDLYKPKITIIPDKPPLRILITEAGSKIGINIMYKICTGDVFGRDQRIILHLINTKGSVMQQRASMLDLEECGFSVLQDLVVSADPDKSYGLVDIVVSIATFEELPGHPPSNSFLYQLNKCRNMARNVRDYAKPDTKIVICGPSTKGVSILLTCVKIFEPSLPIENITGVTCLDEALSKNLLGTELKMTSDRIKNVVIWGTTFPDIFNATVLMHPPDDMGKFEEEDVPVMEALKDHNFVYNVLIPRVYKRILHGNLAKHGMAVAMATSKHLRVMHMGSKVEKEIMAMGTIIPPHEPYGVRRNLGFSVPVTVEKGVVKVREGVKYQTTTELLKQKLLFRLQNDSSMIAIYNMIKYMKDYEEKTGEQFVWTEHVHLVKKESYSPQLLTYIISPDLDEQIPLARREARRKSIVWDDAIEETQAGVTPSDFLTKVNFGKKSKSFM